MVDDLRHVLTQNWGRRFNDVAVAFSLELGGTGTMKAGNVLERDGIENVRWQG